MLDAFLLQLSWLDACVGVRVAVLTPLQAQICRGFERVKIRLTRSFPLAPGRFKIRLNLSRSVKGQAGSERYGS